MKKLAFAITAASGAAAVLSHHDAEASTQHKVQSGESLWTIAQQYNMVFPGQVINVGGSASQNTSSNTSSSSASSHTVVAGESLNIIANKYGVSVDALMQANHLNGYLIMPNQILTIPNGGSGSGSGGTATQTSGNYTSPSFNHQNLYTEGQCTWYVFDKRSQAGKPISTYWSDAKYWA